MRGSPGVSVLLFAAVLLSVGMTQVQPAMASPDEALFPSFQREGALVDRSLSPTDEFDFPSVLHAGAVFPESVEVIDDYYLYTAPHDNPGGIWLFTAPDPSGPWTPYGGGPIIERTWSPHFDVSHVSSPHAFWSEDEQRLYLYFHGENRVTRYATSEDGIVFEYGDVVIDASQLAGDVREASYARVFEYAIPGRDNRYVMTFMDAVPGDGLGGRARRIRLATSNDLRTWSVQDEPLVTPHPSEGTSISGATYFPWNERHYVAYHGSTGNIFITEVGPNFDQQDHLGLLYRPSASGPENGRAAAPTFVTVGDEMHMIYEAGRRGATTIARAVADLSQPLVPLQELPPPPEEPAPDPSPTPSPSPSPSPSEPDPRVFTDVRRSSSHWDDIHVLAATEITNGCGPWSAHTYCPDRAVTRAEMASFLARASGLRQYSSTRFVDVPRNSSHVPGISAIDRAGHTNGCGRPSANTYCPNDPVTRAETATFLARLLGLNKPSSTRYSDVSSNSSHAGGIEAIRRAGLTNGCGSASANTFCPDRPVTRAEMASFLVRAFRLG